MDSRGRFLTALNHEEPDRIPLMGLIVEPATSNKILGKPPADIVSLLPNSVLKSQIWDIANSTWSDLLHSNFSDALEAMHKYGKYPMTRQRPD